MAFNIPFATAGGGTFETKFFSGSQRIDSPASGVLVILTPPPGQRVRLEGLVTNSSSEAGISISLGGVNVITGLGLGSNASAGVGFFLLGRSGTLDARFQVGSVSGGITGGINEVLKIIKDTGSTSVDIGYSYHFGV